MAVIGMDPDFDRRYFDDDSIDLCKSESRRSRAQARDALREDARLILTPIWLVASVVDGRTPGEGPPKTPWLTRVC